MKLHDILELDIESVAFEGKGVAKYNNFVIFVPFVIAGEKVKVEIVKIKSSYAEARLVEVLTPSPLRTVPECEYFSICGSCVYQHLPYEEQLKLKQRQIKELYKQLRRQEPDFEILPTCPSPNQYFYRSKIRMKYKKIKKQFKFGYFDYYSNALVDIDKCLIASKSLNNYLNMVRKNNFDFFRQKRIKAFNLSFMDSDKGVIDNIVKSTSISTKVENKTFLYNRDSFFQINHSIFAVLFEWIIQTLKKEDVKFETFLDLYCGVGFFGIALSDSFKKIQFIESNKVSFDYLLKNIENNHIGNKSEAYYGDADQAIKQIKDSPEVVLMDPPRSGATPNLIKDVIKLQPKIIIYISCNPATQFRDTKYLEDAGFFISVLKPFDFFPQTKHIETIAVFKKKVSS